MHRTRRLWRLLCLALVGSIVLGAAGCLRSANKPLTELAYEAPVKLTVKAGEDIPGTDIQYVGVAENQGAELLIGGQQAFKQKGDSLDWAGTPVPGADVKLTLRIAWYDDQAMHVIGTARLKIDHPTVAPVTVPTSALMTYYAPVAYGMATGALIPGTLYSYVGVTDEGAELSGIEGYPYRKSGDSIVWHGKLRDGVYLKLNVRVVQYDDQGLRVAGIATIVIAP